LPKKKITRKLVTLTSNMRCNIMKPPSLWASALFGKAVITKVQHLLAKVRDL